MSELADAPSAAAFTRNDDPLTIALRCEGTLDFDDLVRLNQARSLANDMSMSTGSASTAVFSSHEASTATKPTSAGTSYPVYDPKGKSKATAIYPSSLSATHGSGSESDLERESSQKIDLLGTGSWMSDNLASRQVLKDDTKARPRTYRRSVFRHKKPTIVVHQDIADPGTANNGATAGPLSSGGEG
jgi:hypothetical protein